MNVISQITLNSRCIAILWGILCFSTQENEISGVGPYWVSQSFLSFIFGEWHLSIVTWKTVKSVACSLPDYRKQHLRARLFTFLGSKLHFFNYLDLPLLTRTTWWITICYALTVYYHEVKHDNDGVGGGGGGGGDLTKLNTERLRPEVQPLNFYIPFFADKVPLHAFIYWNESKSEREEKRQ